MERNAERKRRALLQKQQAEQPQENTIEISLGEYDNFCFHGVTPFVNNLRILAETSQNLLSFFKDVLMFVNDTTQEKGKRAKPYNLGSQVRESLENIDMRVYEMVLRAIFFLDLLKQTFNDQDMERLKAPFMEIYPRLPKIIKIVTEISGTKPESQEMVTETSGESLPDEFQVPKEAFLQIEESVGKMMLTARAIKEAWHAKLPLLEQFINFAHGVVKTKSALPDEKEEAERALFNLKREKDDFGKYLDEVITHLVTLGYALRQKKLGDLMAAYLATKVIGERWGEAQQIQRLVRGRWGI